MDYESYQTTRSVNVHTYRSHSRTGMDDYMVQEHLDSMNAQLNSTRAQRIRAAIFPETLEDGTNEIPMHTSMPSTHFVNGHATAVQKLSEPSQLLKNAVIDIINYKDDAEITEKALPELIRLLNDDDPIVAGQAALVLHTLARKEASRLALATPQMKRVVVLQASSIVSRNKNKVSWSSSEVQVYLYLFVCWSKSNRRNESVSSMVFVSLQFFDRCRRQSCLVNPA
jgi:hypothetical protein